MNAHVRMHSHFTLLVYCVLPSSRITFSIAPLPVVCAVLGARLLPHTGWLHFRLHRIRACAAVIPGATSWYVPVLCDAVFDSCSHADTAGYLTLTLTLGLNVLCMRSKA